MNTSFEVIFLGTAAGKPSNTRNVSSLCLRMDGDVWMFDAGEATQHQLINDRNRLVRMSKISKIFITHMHGDHIYGLPGLLASATEAAVSADQQSVIDIYGPKGLREYLGTISRLTSTDLSQTHRVHELLFAGEQPTPVSPSEAEGGRTVLQGEDGTWDVVMGEDDRAHVRAAPIVHRVPCIGYAIQEQPGYSSFDMTVLDPLLTCNAAALKAQGVHNPRMLLSQLKGPTAKPITLPDGTILEPVPRDRPGRKVVVLGDTCDASGPMAGLAKEADLLIHEATNVRIDKTVSSALATKGETDESCRERMVTRGHSTPQMAGEYARAVGAKQLVVNHISPRLQPDDVAVMDVVRRAATMAWQYPEGREVIVARDFMVLEVPKPDSGDLVRITDDGRALVNGALKT